MRIIMMNLCLSLSAPYVYILLHLPGSSTGETVYSVVSGLGSLNVRLLGTRPSILVGCLMTVIKYLAKATQGRKGLFGLMVWVEGSHGAESSVSCPGSVRRLSTMHPQSGSRERCMPGPCLYSPFSPFQSVWGPSPWDDTDNVDLHAVLPQLNLSGYTCMSSEVCLPGDSKYSQVDNEDWIPHLVLSFTDLQQGPSLFGSFLTSTMEVILCLLDFQTYFL